MRAHARGQCRGGSRVARLALEASGYGAKRCHDAWRHGWGGLGTPLARNSARLAPVAHDGLCRALGRDIKARIRCVAKTLLSGGDQRGNISGDQEFKGHDRETPASQEKYLIFLTNKKNDGRQLTASAESRRALILKNREAF